MKKVLSFVLCLMLCLVTFTAGGPGAGGAPKK